MPCCCKTNVQAAFVLGIIGIVLSLASCLYEIYHFSGGGIFLGIVGALISAILVYGAHVRNHKAILIWMILDILQSIGHAIYTIYTVSTGSNSDFKSMHFPSFKSPTKSLCKYLKRF